MRTFVFYFYTVLFARKFMSIAKVGVIISLLQGEVSIDYRTILHLLIIIFTFKSLIYHNMNPWTLFYSLCFNSSLLYFIAQILATLVTRDFLKLAPRSFDKLLLYFNTTLSCMNFSLSQNHLSFYELSYLLLDNGARSR